MSLFTTLVCMDYMLLTVMAYDRFVAICHPLHYTVIMNPRLCGFLILGSFLLSLLDSQLHNLVILKVTSFKDVEISNFYCDPSELLNLSCSYTYSNIIVKYVLIVIYGLFPISGILFSYYKIISSILRIPSSGGKYKAFSTCGSHLSVFCLFLGTGITVYFGSAVSHSPRKGAVASVMYTVVTPMLNPFIYSLRNRDIKSDLRRLQIRTLGPLFKNTSVGPLYSGCRLTLLRSEKDGSATRVDAVCTYHPDPVGPKLDREKLYWELSPLTHGITQLGPYALDQNSLYVNGYTHQATATTPTASGPPLESFTLNFTITNLRYEDNIQPPGSLTFNTTQKVLQHLVSTVPVPLWSCPLEPACLCPTL
uniref:olfactory receptor 18-like n=1 Tax=Ictidomys tridecemlineatus TaxID=43179 RepID=UPI001A9ED51A|nr:olfactory receptor 18-like [Ictidomys tridecemlineatus]